MNALLPLLLKLPPEHAHLISICALRTGIFPKSGANIDPRLEVDAAGITFPNPLGLAAGYDKNGEVPHAILQMGFGFTETGTVTPRPQSGNPKPRIFRLPEVKGVINRLGFNNEGHDVLVRRLTRTSGKPGIIGINIGANKDTKDFIADYEIGIRHFNSLASYFAVNISSPNTPGLRGLQTAQSLRELVARISATRENLVANGKRRVPIFIKIAPDLRRVEMDAISEIILASDMDGLIISNTTISRGTVANHPDAAETGGLSGRPVFKRSTAVLAQMRQRLGSDLPIIGVGGIDSAETAIQKMSAGATLLQLYTGLIYQGPSLAMQISKGILHHLDQNKLEHVTSLTGTHVSEWADHYFEDAT